MHSHLHTVFLGDLQDVVLSDIAGPELNSGRDPNLEADDPFVVVELDPVTDKARPVAVVLWLDISQHNVARLTAALQQDPVVIGADALGYALLDCALFVTAGSPMHKRKDRMFTFDVLVFLPTT